MIARFSDLTESVLIQGNNKLKAFAKKNGYDRAFSLRRIIGNENNAILTDDKYGEWFFIDKEDYSYLFVLSTNNYTANTRANQIEVFRYVKGDKNVDTHHSFCFEPGTVQGTEEAKRAGIFARKAFRLPFMRAGNIAKLREMTLLRFPWDSGEELNRIYKGLQK